VLGANDAILSTASLVLGVAAAHGNHWNVMVAGVAALFARACRWRQEKYVSVHSKVDIENADLDLERKELGEDDQVVADFVFK